ncbi:hypothetical protein ABI_34720 [Asticcacaulis biprosthecium C19]|uniref:Uncharacterized protein n=1 Tax=Asticcacaulis biprosthecium C19 TaxID=715226 RepID=F4QQG3_9CAUL|nr:hypothetical protein ABI_34720 [Asticcacaulis biprosthecium C19]
MLALSAERTVEGAFAVARRGFRHMLSSPSRRGKDGTFQVPSHRTILAP